MMNNPTNLFLIEGIYDLLSHRTDGVITPCAPLVMQVGNTLPGDGERVEILLCPDDGGEPIPVSEVCIRTMQKIIVMLPYLPPGRYRPQMTVYKQGEVPRTIRHGEEVWTVEKEVR